MLTLAQIQKIATSWNRPFVDLVSLIRRIREAYIKYPGIYQGRERASFLGGYCDDEQFERLKEILVQDFIQQDLGPQTGSLISYTCDLCRPMRPWVANQILLNGEPQPPVCPACCRPAKILTPRGE